MFEHRRWRRLFRWSVPRVEQRCAATDVDTELEFHVEMRMRELLALGLSEPDARVEALRRFGDISTARVDLTRTTEHRARRAAVIVWLDDLRHDLGFALRSVRRRPGLSATAITTLALGLGLSTAVLAVVNRLVLHPLPYPGSDRFAKVWLASEQTPMKISPELRILGPWRARVAGAEWIEGWNEEELLLEGGESAELVQTRRVTPGLLPVLGARIALGRGIEPSDTVAGAPLVTLLSWGAWQRRFGGARDAIGQSVRIDGRIEVVAGVVEKGFDLTALEATARAEFWLPLGGPGQAGQWMSVLVLRRPGVPAAAITSELRAALAVEGITSEMLEKFPATAVDPSEFADQGRDRTLWLLTLAVLLVLAVACANVAALLLGEAAARARELGVRTALGAGRGRIVRQLITEAWLLGGVGGTLGFGVAAAALWLTRVTRPETLLTLDEVTVNPRVMLGATGLTFLVAMLFGLAPAWAGARADAAMLIGRVTRAFDTRFGRSLRSMLVVGQLAASLLLVNGAGLLLRSFLTERSLPIGFNRERLGWIDLEISRRVVPNDTARDAIAANALAAVRKMPGVAAATLSGDSPMGYGVLQGEFLIDGRPVPEVETATLMPSRSIGPDYFQTIGMVLDEGRAPDARPGANEVVIDREAARRFFPRGDALGSRVRFSRDRDWQTIVGVAPEARELLGAFPGAPFIFSAATSGEAGSLIVRTTGDLPLDRLNAAIRAVDSRIRIRTVQTAEAALDERLAGRRFTTTIVIGFAGLALLLAAVGLYGVVALAVSRRTYEMGVRLALGAAPARVRMMVLREGGVQVAIGLGIGIALMAASGRLLNGLLSGVSAWDPAVWIGAAAVLGVAGLLACWLPARRASRVDPMTALRAE